MFGLPSNIGEWLQAMRELHKRQAEASERLATAAERMADALEGRTESGTPLTRCALCEPII